MSKKSLFLLLCVFAGSLEAGNNRLLRNAIVKGLQGPVSALFEQARAADRKKNNRAVPQSSSSKLSQILNNSSRRTGIKSDLSRNITNAAGAVQLAVSKDWAKGNEAYAATPQALRGSKKNQRNKWNHGYNWTAFFVNLQVHGIGFSKR